VDSSKINKIYQEIILALSNKKSLTSFDLEKIKRIASKKYLISLPKNSELLSVYHELVHRKVIPPRSALARLLVTRRVRSLSGVTVISVLTKPYPCPGNCLYCPDQKGVPRSYLRNEPAVMRAIDNNYDPYLQTINRIKALKRLGHPVDKLELIVIGGTWSSLPKKYQTSFIHQCFQAANMKKSKSLEEAQRINTKSPHRIIGLTVETRPDYITQKDIIRMRRLGVTKIELGVQCLNEEILSFNRRGHGLKAIIDATRLLKDAGFKIGYHLMLNLPGANIAQEKKDALKIFQEDDFRPDFLKIYPTAIVAEAPLYQLWKEGKYKPYQRKELIDLIKFVKKNTPDYCRIQRVIRDIPSESVPVGPVRTTNLREIILQQLKEEGTPCRCIRCREIKDQDIDFKPILFREDYASGKGLDIFLTFENKDKTHLLALLRLRIPSYAFTHKTHFIPHLEGAALIREVHTYGQHLNLGSQSTVSPQHRGLGKKLIEEAEIIIKREYHSQIRKIAIIAGIGTREYYQHLGYQLEGTYMVKNLFQTKNT